jgi:putative two-component system hydrogenase maturation factor HypX/HoxX
VGDRDFGGKVRVLLLVSAFNGLSQRAWCLLRDAGHQVGVLLATGEQDIIDGVQAAQPDLIICPYLTERVPAQVWQHVRTVVIRPAPPGERGPSPLDWAITGAATTWGVTALGAVEQLGAGPLWASRTFGMPAAPPRKSALYNGPVADAAMECIVEVVQKAADPSFTPAPAAGPGEAVDGARRRPAMTQAGRAFDWTDGTEHILRRIRAADGSPGVRTGVAGLDVFAYDAHPGMSRGARPGALISRRQGAVLVGTGDGSIWLGHLRQAEPGSIKLPATTLLGRRLRGVPNSPLPPGTEPEVPSYRQVRYRRTGAVGWLAFDFYNGAMSVGHCRRLLAAVRHAAAQDTQVLVLRGGIDAFSTGLHLTVVQAATDPAGAAWANVRALNELSREIITCTRQVVIAAYAGSADAGGAMLGLGADVVAARSGVVLNPYYDLGVYGSELHTYTLPRRVGAAGAQRLLSERLPISAEQAAALGLVDEVGPRHPDAYAAWLTDLAERYAEPKAAPGRRAAKARRLAAERVPLDVYEARELAEMSRDLFEDRSGFAAARRAAVAGIRPTSTPARWAFPAPEPPRQIARPRPGTAAEAGQLVRPAVPQPPVPQPAVPQPAVPQPA